MKTKKFHPLPGIHLWAKITGFSGKQQARTEKMTHPSLHPSAVRFLSYSFLVSGIRTSSTSQHKWEHGQKSSTQQALAASSEKINGFIEKKGRREKTSVDLQQRTLISDTVVQWGGTVAQRLALMLHNKKVPGLIPSWAGQFCVEFTNSPHMLLFFFFSAKTLQ